mmetsp:Transcript_1699/g.3752  ORF Transcript_1699/g.3752 Transcript_1699/m.3752 type:complete len:147 (-) Transcript_1699:274-714(-)
MEGKKADALPNCGGTQAPATATAVAIDDDAEGQSKLGHKCCGCCCDTRRAVIIVEIVFGIFINILNIIFVISGMGVEVVGDPYLEEDIKNALKISAVFLWFGYRCCGFCYVWSKNLQYLDSSNWIDLEYCPNDMCDCYQFPGLPRS